jgi:hypothetical protein
MKITFFGNKNDENIGEITVFYASTVGSVL